MSQQEKWDDRFSQKGYAYGDKANTFLKESTHHLPKGKILSLGEGEGRNAIYLAQLGYDVTAIDYSQVGLDKTQKRAKENNVEIRTIQADLSGYILEKDYWQGIISIYLHVHKNDRSKIHRNCVAALAQNGVFIMESYSTDQIKFGTGGPKNTDLLLDLDEVLRELEGLELNLARVIEREIIEGEFHTGMGSVVQIIGVKK